jgi:hypothetical protein
MKIPRLFLELLQENRRRQKQTCIAKITGAFLQSYVNEYFEQKLYGTRQAMYVKRNIKARSYNHCCSGRSMNITQPVHVCCCLWYPACNAYAPHCHLWPAPLYNIFPHYLINDTNFGIKCIEHKMCFDFLYNFCLKHFSRRNERDNIKSVYRSSCKEPVILVRF